MRYDIPGEQEENQSSFTVKHKKKKTSEINARKGAAEDGGEMWW